MPQPKLGSKLLFSIAALLATACGQKQGHEAPGKVTQTFTLTTAQVASRLDAPPRSADRNGSDVALHMFNFSFDAINAQLDAIQQAGVAAIQISPPQLSNGDAWWGRYQPLDLRVIDGPLGNQAALQRLIDNARARGIGINVDVVFNHMANLGANADLHYPPRWVQEKYAVGGLFSPQDFHYPFCISNWNNPEEVRLGRICAGNGDTGLPDLKTNSDWVVNVQREYLNKLKSMGVAGFRVDAAKHMEADHLNRVFSSDMTNGHHTYGEIIAFRDSFDRDLEPYLRLTRMGFLDFPLHETLRQAFSWNGEMRALVRPMERRGALAADRAVTFAINHDIPNNDGFREWALYPDDETLAYTYILGRSDGVPLLYSDQGQADGLRDDRWKNAHLRPDLHRMILFHNTMHGLDQREIFADSCVLIFTRGQRGLVGINKCATPWTGSFDFGLNGRFHDLLSETETRLNGRSELHLPARCTRLLARLKD